MRAVHRVPRVSPILLVPDDRNHPIPDLFSVCQGLSILVFTHGFPVPRIPGGYGVVRQQRGRGCFLLFRSTFAMPQRS